MKLVALLIAAAAAVAGTVIVGSAASAQGPTTRTLTFRALERGSTFIHVRNTRPPSRRANMLGDQITFTNRLADTAGTVIGKQHITCTTTVSARNFLKSKLACTGVAVLRDGTVTFQAVITSGERATTGAVTGGTGAYANARGTFVDETQPNGDSVNTVTLVTP